MGALLPPSSAVLSGGRAASATAGDGKFSSEGDKDKDAKFMKNVRMTRKFYPTKLAVVAFSLIGVLLAQRHNQVASISKNLNEAAEKMNELTEVVHSLRDELEKGK